MMFARRADPALPVGGANMSEPQDAASESMRQTAMPGHGWPAPEGDDVRSQRSRSGFAGRRSHLSGGPWMARSESSSQLGCSDSEDVSLLSVVPVPVTGTDQAASCESAVLRSLPWF